MSGGNPTPYTGDKKIMNVPVSFGSETIGNTTVDITAKYISPNTSGDEEAVLAASTLFNINNQCYTFNTDTNDVSSLTAIYKGLFPNSISPDNWPGLLDNIYSHVRQTGSNLVSGDGT